MMESWFTTLKQALTRPLTLDPLGQGKDPGRLRDNLKHLYPSVRKHWRPGLLSACLTLLAALLTLPMPLVYRQFIDTVLLDRQLQYLPLVVLLTAGISLASLALGICKEWYAGTFEQRVNLDLQERLFAHVLKLPKAFFEDKETGYLLGRIRGDVGGLRWFYSTTLVTLAVQALQFIGGLVLLFTLEWRLTLIALVFLPVTPAATYFFSRRLRGLTEAQMEQNARAGGSLGSSLSSVDLIKSCTAEKRTLRQMLSTVKASADAQMEQRALNQLSRIASNLGPSAVQLIVLCISAYWIVKGEWTLGSLAAFQSYLGFVFRSPQAIANMSVPFMEARVSLERVNRFFNLVPEENYDTGRQVERLTGAVEFRNLSFSYDGRTPVLENLSLRIRPGERVAIVGPSGIGKTTLISLLLLFYRPTSGEILFEGEPASVYEVQSLRRRIGYMAQKTQLLYLSILENVRYGNPEASREEVRRACGIAGIGSFVEGLPKGLDTQVGGPDGIGLSEGQAQRLCLARALVKEPDILLLDEPTSAIDLVTEKSIIDSLPAAIRGKTLFIVAHRLSTIKDCGRILLLDENRLLAYGTHEELLRTNDYYRRLIEIQRSSALDGGKNAAPARLVPPKGVNREHIPIIPFVPLKA